MKEKLIKRYLDNYSEIRGTIIKKRKCLFGKCEIIVITDGKKTVSVKIGKAISPVYPIGCELTVGHIGRRLINIRPGIVYDE